MGLFKWLGVASLVVFSSLAAAEVSEQYDTASELMEAHQDYHPSNNTFEVIDPDVPHYRLSAIAFKNEPEEVTYYQNWRAAVYGIYSVLAHTPIHEVSVTAIPLQTQGFNSPEEPVLLEDKAVSIEINRDQALDAIGSLIDVESLGEVKVETDYGYQWSDDFIDVYYEDKTPGLGALISELKKYCVNDCQ